MPINYDKYYHNNPDALGPPTRRIVEAFDWLPILPLRVLDVGCGQGRDAVFIARLGHSVVGVDHSPNGIAELERCAADENLPITGIVADIENFMPEGLFDVLLFDRSLHMLDARQRVDCFKRLLNHIAPKGWVVIEDESCNLPDLKSVISDDPRNWDIQSERKGHLVLRLL